MADVPVEVKKTAPTETTAPDVWGSFRSELDRLFDRFGFPSLRRMFEIEPTWRPTTSFTFSAPAIDLSEDDNAYKISAELPGLDAKDVELSVSGNTLVLKGEKRQEKPSRRRWLGPLREEVYRVAARLHVRGFAVSNGALPIRPTGMSNVSMVRVADGADAADDWIAEHTGATDSPLALRCLKSDGRCGAAGRNAR